MQQLSGLQIPRRGPRYVGSDLALGLLILTIVGVMLLPVPQWLLDVMLTLNLAGSLSVLLLVVHAGRASKFTTFPSLLLLATLLRLSLAVATTRLILLEGNAGEVVSTFGHLVVGADYVVGAVVFAMLAIVQLVVIAKGSERIAEVAARFCLDAMPGRQLAIDSELRAGTLDSREASSRRFALQREGQFYGAMDGAMRFVRGDAIASLLITVVTLLGGLGLGIFAREMSFAEALRRYSLLTIGNGLVMLLPALLLATAAGVLVTRIEGDPMGRPLGQELGTQLLRAPQSFTVAGALLLILAIVPGMPSIPFLFVGAGLVAGSVLRAQRKRPGVDPAFALDERAEGERTQPEFSPQVAPWTLEVGQALAHLISDERHGRTCSRPGIETALVAARRALWTKLGVPLPAAVVSVNPAIGPRDLVLTCHEVPESTIEVAPSIDEASVAEFVLQNVLPVLERRAGDFLGIPETQRLLDELELTAPVLVREVVPKSIGVPGLTLVLKQLVDEGVSIRNLGGILEVLATASSKETEPSRLAESVRVHRSRALTHELTGGRGSLDVYLLDPGIEDAIRGAIRRTGTEGHLVLAPAAARDIVAAVRAIVPPAPQHPPVLLTQPDIRYFVRRLLQVEFPALRVVSHTELSAGTAVSCLATARIGA